MGQQNVREVALDLLIRMEKAGSFSHLLITHAISDGKVNAKDEALLTELVYGTMERKLTLAYDLSHFVQTKKQVMDWVQTLLQLSLYQLRYLDAVPTYAIIDEAVNIAKKRGHKGIASFVNGVLRNADRKGAPDFSTIENHVERLAIETSHPMWMVERWIASYGWDITEEMCMMNITKKPLTIRVNTQKISRADLMEKLHEENIECVASSYSKYGIIIRNGNIFKTSIISDGLATVQDISSILAASFLDAQDHMTVLDCCSAPGGKATYLAERMHNTGKVFAYDIHKNKTKLIKQNAKRLGLDHIQVGNHDARKLDEIHKENEFERIIVDAPCSGLGIIRSKPDIKYNKSVTDIEQLSRVQTDILQQIAPLLKENGKMVYSTCTIDRLENEEVVEAFLRNNPAFKVDPTFFEEVRDMHLEKINISDVGLQLFPQSCDGDGFFVTRLVRVCNEDGA